MDKHVQFSPYFSFSKYRFESQITILNPDLHQYRDSLQIRFAQLIEYHVFVLKMSVPPIHIPVLFKNCTVVYVTSATVTTEQFFEEERTLPSEEIVAEGVDDRVDGTVQQVGA